VDDELELQLLDVAADRTLTRRRLHRRHHAGVKRIEEPQQLDADLRQRLAPALVAARVLGVCEHRVALDALQTQRNVHLFQERLDQGRDHELPVDSGELVLHHELGVTADVREDQHDSLLARLACGAHRAILPDGRSVVHPRFGLSVAPGTNTSLFRGRGDWKPELTLLLAQPLGRYDCELGFRASAKGPYVHCAGLMPPWRWPVLRNYSIASCRFRDGTPSAGPLGRPE